MSGSRIRLAIVAVACLARLARGDGPAVEWTFDVSGGTVQRAWVHGDTVYLQTPFCTEPKFPAMRTTPGLAPLRSEPGFPYNPMIAALDGRTGQLRWARLFCGELLFAPDPTGRDIWAMGTSLFRLDADHGTTSATVPLDRRWRQLRAVRAKGTLAWSSSHARGTSGERMQTFDLDAGEVVESSVETRDATGRTVIVDEPPGRQRKGEAMRVRVLDAGGRELWTHGQPGMSAGRATFLADGDVLIAGGVEASPGDVSRLDGKTGEPRWTTRLPRGLYRIGWHPIRHNDERVAATWDVFGTLDATRLFAIDEAGTVHVLDARDGTILGSAASGPTHLGAPALVGESLVLLGDRQIESIALDVVLGKARPATRPSRLAPAYAAIEAGKLNVALGLAEAAARSAPDDVETWRLMREVVRAREANPKRFDTDPAWLPRAVARLLELGEPIDEAMRDRFGLVAYVPTEPPSTSLVVAGQLFYLPTRDGRLWAIDPGDATSPPRVVERTPLPPGTTGAFRIGGRWLFAGGPDRRTVGVAALTGVGERPPRDELLWLPVDPFQEWLVFGHKRGDATPPEWAAYADDISPILRLDGRLIRTRLDGAVRELTAAGAVVEHPPVRAGFGKWRINQTIVGPVGCARGGVYRLDENFRPVEAIVRPERMGDRAPEAFMAERDGETIAVLADGAAIEIWTDAPPRRKKIRREIVGYADEFVLRDEPARLMKLNDGYLYAGGELIWVPTDPSRPAWRFHPAGRLEQRGSTFRCEWGVPRVRDGRLFVTNGAGGLYVFDVAQVTRAR